MQSHSAPVDWGWTLNRLFDDNTTTGYQSKADGYWPAYFTFNVKPRSGKTKPYQDTAT